MKPSTLIMRVLFVVALIVVFVSDGFVGLAGIAVMLLVLFLLLVGLEVLDRWWKDRA